MLHSTRAHPLTLLSTLAGLCLAAGCQTSAVPADAGETPSPSPPPTVPQAAEPPPPIVGGGLLVTADQRLAVAADLDRDVVWIVDLEAGVERGRVTLEPGDRPNRMAVDGEGRVHVALRGGGALLRFDPYGLDVGPRTPVCAGPRGVAYDPADDTLYVACLHGALIGLDPTTHREKRRVTVAADLRDVVVDGERVLVSTFRSAEVFAVHPDDRVEPVVAAVEVDAASVDGVRRHVPRVAWRMAGGPDGVRILHQRHRIESLPELPAPVVYYDSAGRVPGNGVVHATAGRVDRAAAAAPERRLTTALAVDMAIGPDGALAFADPTTATPGIGRGDHGALLAERHVVRSNGAVAVAWRGADLVTFVREPAALHIARPLFDELALVGRVTINLDGRTVADAGHALFHQRTSTGITCASCHPEGGEDGHVWHFDAFGPRRTQSLRGGVSHRAPFHWSGDLPDFAGFMTEVFVERMGGDPVDDPARLAALAGWLDSVPHLPRPTTIDADAIERGRALFAQIGCDECHFTDGTTDPDNHDVGTGEPLQVPSLVGVGLRLPLMHDGCAPTIAARFDPACGGDDHGPVDRLDADQQADLTAFLDAL